MSMIYSKIHILSCDICEKSDIMICQGEPHWLKDLVPIPLAVRHGVALESGGRAGRAKALRMPVGSRCSWMLPGPLEQYGGFVAAPLPGDLQHRASVAIPHRPGECGSSLDGF